MWLNFDNVSPDEVRELLPHARTILADIENIGRAGAEFLWSQVSTGEEPEDRSAEFFELMKPTSLVVFLSRDFEVHYEEISDSYFYMDGYWPSVHFRADHTPVDHAIEA